jgi:hypothetical protein
MGKLRGFYGHQAVLGLTLTFLSIGSIAVPPLPALAYEPIHSKNRLAKPVRETVVRVRTARVVLADYGLIRGDFAETRAMSDAQVDEWLLSKTAYISKKQAAQAVANTPILTGPETAVALRPDFYGRALVYQAGPREFIDGKGTGVAPTATPSLEEHSDGLATLGEVTREFLYEKLVRTVLSYSGAKFETVGHYGVIDWGFDVVHADGSRSPAGMILRQAHERIETWGSMLAESETREVELTLRRFGLTSAGAYRHDSSYEKINVQGTVDGGILDFGGFIAEEKFEKPARMFYGFGDIIESGQIDFVQPDARIRVPMRHWGYTTSGIDDPKFDNPWVWSHELARSFREGRAERAAFKLHFENLVGTYRRELLFMGGEATPGVMETLVRALHDVH